MFSLTCRFAAVAELLFSEGNLRLEDLQDINSVLTAEFCVRRLRTFIFLFF